MAHYLTNLASQIELDYREAWVINDILSHMLEDPMISDILKSKKNSLAQAIITYIEEGVFVL